MNRAIVEINRCLQVLSISHFVSERYQSRYYVQQILLETDSCSNVGYGEHLAPQTCHLIVVLQAVVIEHKHLSPNTPCLVFASLQPDAALNGKPRRDSLWLYRHVGYALCQCALTIVPTMG